jgi:hypothetical protein
MPLNDLDIQPVQDAVQSPAELVAPGEIEAAPEPRTTRSGHGVHAPQYLHDYVQQVEQRWT